MFGRIFLGGFLGEMGGNKNRFQRSGRGGEKTKTREPGSLSPKGGPFHMFPTDRYNVASTKKNEKTGLLFIFYYFWVGPKLDINAPTAAGTPSLRAHTSNVCFF